MFQKQPPPDERIIRRVLAGRRDEFGVLVTRYLSVIHALAYAQVGNHADAEDIAQEAFVKAFQALDSLRERAKFGPWLTAIARNTCARLLRSRAREALGSDKPGLEPLATAPDMEGRELREILRQKVMELEEGPREVLLLHYFADKTTQEMASLLEISTEAAKKRLQRAREALSNRLADDLTELLGPRRSAKDRAARVMGVVGSVPVSWQVSATSGALGLSGAAKTLGGVVIMHKLIVIPVVLVAMTFGFWTLHGENDAVHTTNSPAREERVAQRAQQPEAPPRVAAAAGEPQQATQTVAQKAEKPVDLSNAQAVWNKVLKVNRVWLDPRPEHLSYTLYMGAPPPGNMKELVNQVWIAGNKGRWEMEGMAAQRKLRYRMVFQGDKAVYLEPQMLLEKSPMPMKDAASLHQGTTLHTGIHALARDGLPDSARIVETRETPQGKVLVLEAELDGGRGNVGLGLRHTHFGQSQYRIDRIRLHILIPAFVPVLEEDFTKDEEKKCDVEIGPEFLPFGAQRAPGTLTWRPLGDLGIKKWVLKAEFQKVDNAWVLDEGLNVQDGKQVRRIFTFDISTKPSDPALFEFPDDEKLAALKSAWQPEREIGKADGVDRPRVVSVYPPHRSTEVPVEMELRIRFDRPMKSHTIDFGFDKGGFTDCAPAQYDPETFEFAVPVLLAPGTRHRAVVNRRPRFDRSPRDVGFQSEAGIGAAPYEWSFETISVKPPGNVPVPKVESITPSSGSTVGCLTLIQVTFDQPMDPTSYGLAKPGDERDPVQHAMLIRHVNYDPGEKRFTFPVVLPPDWQGVIELTGLRSAEGVAAEPLRLELATTRELYSEEQLEHFKRAGQDPRLRAVLRQMREARSGLTSLAETIHTLRYDFSREDVFQRMSSNSATFKFQGDRQFYGDVSDIMQCSFIVGSDGDQCWWYYKSGFRQDRVKEFLRVAPFEAIHEKNVSACDPFDLQRRDIQEAVDELHLEYKGTVPYGDRTCHIIQSTSARLREDSVWAYITRWWVDGRTFMPIQLARDSAGSRWLSTFDYDHVNATMRDGEFAPIALDRVTPEELDPLHEGCDTYFLTVMDGSSGLMSVRWGQKGPEGMRSSGLS